MRLTQRINLFPAVVALTLASFASSAFAQQTVTVNSGTTGVKLSHTFTSALSSLKVSVGTIAPTRIDDGEALFPVTGGAIDLDTAAGNILHSGGLTFTAGGIQTKLQSFIIDTTGSQPVITGLVVVNGKLVGRLPLFNLTLPSGFSLPLKTQWSALYLSGVGVTLSAQAASALNSVYSASAFAEGLSVGKAEVLAFGGNQHWHPDAWSER